MVQSGRGFLLGEGCAFIRGVASGSLDASGPKPPNVWGSRARRAKVVPSTVCGPLRLQRHGWRLDEANCLFQTTGMGLPLLQWQARHFGRVSPPERVALLVYQGLVSIRIDRGGMWEE